MMYKGFASKNMTGYKTIDSVDEVEWKNLQPRNKYMYITEARPGEVETTMVLSDDWNPIIRN